MSKEEIKTLAIYATTNGNKYCSTKCEWWYAGGPENIVLKRELPIFGGMCNLFKIMLKKEKDGEQRIKRCSECKKFELTEEDFGYSR